MFSLTFINTFVISVNNMVSATKFDFLQTKTKLNNL